MKKIFKYGPLSFGETNSFDLPEVFHVVHFGLQDGRMYFWAEIDTQEGQYPRKFAVIGTGWDVPEGHMHLGTAQEGSYVWHLYENWTEEV